MPRNGSGTYTLPSGNPVVSGTLIDSTWANNTLSDLANEITNSLSRNGSGGMLAPLRFADGSLGAPGFAWTNETSSGFYRLGAGEMWGVVLGEQILQYTTTGTLVPSGKTFTLNGTFAGTGYVPVANGGTGATDAATARTNLGAQATLVSGTNIKTVGGVTILGSGDISVGTGDVTLTGTQTLTNKTLSTGTVLGAAVTGGDFTVTRIMLKDTGWTYFSSGTTNALDYTNGSHQRWTPNVGAQTLSITNWPPTGNLGELLIEGVNLGASTITWPTINWVQPSGTTTTTISTYLSAISRTLQSSGTDFVFLWTRDAGTTIYGKLI